MSLSTLTTAFLNAPNATELAHVLGFTKYSELAYLIFPSSKYSTFKIKKKNGTDREIHVPAKKLKDAQHKLLIIFNELDNSRAAAHGFRKERSVFTNAKCHSGEKINFVFNLDLKDFFPSITFARVRGIFLSQPFNLDPRVATVVARLCTYKGILPQGAPTSPAISNFICRGLDGSLMQLAKNNLATYTRYADDLTFSFTKKKRVQLPSDIVDVSSEYAVVGKALQAAIDKHDFVINTSKVRLRSRHVRMEVTGLTVNEFPNVQRRYVDEIRGMLNAWEAHGLVNAQTVFATKSYKRQLRSGVIPPFENVLRGKILYLKMIKSEQDKVYNSLARRFNSCVNSFPKCNAKKLPVSNLVINEKDLEKSIFLVSSINDTYSFEIKGTGFFLEGIGLITCDHVIKYPKNKDAKNKVIYDFPDAFIDKYFGFNNDEINLQDCNENNICSLDVIWTSASADVAVLRPKQSSLFEYLNLKAVSFEKIIKEIQLVGFPFPSIGKNLSFAEGKIRTRYRRYEKQHYDITALIRQGNSGGPVLDKDFQVVGVAKEGELQDHGNNGVLQVQEVIKLNEIYVGIFGPPDPNTPKMFW